jgi:chromosome segregation ATPase
MPESSFDPSGWTPEAQAVLEEHLKACEDQLREMERQLEGVAVPVTEEEEAVAAGSPDLKALDDEMGELMAALEASTNTLRSTQSKPAAFG